MDSSNLSRRNMIAAVGLAGASTLVGRTLFGQAEKMDDNMGAMLEDYFKPSNFYADGEWKLPKLPYDVAALEPHIDAKTMELHHDKHHKAYVDNLNKALKKVADAKGDLEPGVVEVLQRDVSFNLGGHANHSFWGIMAPNAGGEPTGKVAELINGTFGDFKAFKAYFTKVATTIKGSGWAVLAFAPVSQTLVTYALKDQDGQQPAGVMPILAVDVWEHAYYLKYQNNRAALPARGRPAGRPGGVRRGVVQHDQLEGRERTARRPRGEVIVSPRCVLAVTLRRR